MTPCTLTRRQLREIAAFDRTRRTARSYDPRRYGSVTGKPRRAKDADYPTTRKTLCYNYIARRRREVSVLHVAVRIDGYGRQVVKPVACWDIKTGRGIFGDIDCRPIAGWLVRWHERDWRKPRATSRKSRHASRLAPRPGTPILSSWWGDDPWTFGTGSTFPWHESINPEALKGTRFEYCQYADNLPVHLVDWLMLFRSDPKVELLAKARLWPLISPAGLKALKDRRFFAYVREHLPQLAGQKYRIRELLWAYRHGCTLAAASDHFGFMEDMSGYLCGVAWQGRRHRRLRLDYDRLRKTLPKWGIHKAEYARYLSMAAEVGLDLRNEGTVYPPVTGGRKAFLERMERIEAELAKRRAAEERACRAALRKERAEAKARAEAERRWIESSMKDRAAELEAFQKSLNRSAVLRGSGYTLVLAKSQKELLAEGRRMRNCVGNGVYGRAIVTGESLIVMLGFAGKSYCDIEISRRRWTVQQCYLHGNQLPPEEVRELANKIALVLKAEHRRHRKLKLFKSLRRAA